MPWGLVLLVTLLGVAGVAMLYSAGGASWQPWAQAQALRLLICLGLMLFIAITDIRLWLRMAYVLYGLTLFLLLVVEIKGHIGMGAQRWLNLGFMVLQPSELMKITLLLALARYFHNLPPERITDFGALITPVLLLMAPVGLVLLQPNLGTALLLILATGAVFLAAGVRAYVFIVALLLVAIIVPIGWEHLHDYQQQRVLTFLNPEADPRGTGYNILQAKIAMGSGGLWGKGFAQGTQGQLQFLPEKHTDFIFVLLGEELGFFATIFVVLLYAGIMFYALLIALGCRHLFGKLVAIGLMSNIFLYVFVNIAMVTGLIPVVGIPLPILSYGGTAMLTFLIGCGLLLNVALHRDSRLPKNDYGLI